jgi:hypothetical protein
MIRRLEDLPQKAIFISRSKQTRRQGRPKYRWPEGGTAIARPLGPRIERIELRIESNGKNFFERP